MVPENIQDIRIEQDEDLIFTTVKSYKFFIAKRKEGGLDAKLLYDHLQFTARLQKTNSIKANDNYLKNGLGFGDKKLKVAKAFLKKYGFIEYRQARKEDGTLEECFISVRMTGGSKIAPAEPVGQKTTPAVDRTSGDEKQMLKIENEMLKKEIERLNQEKPAPAKPPRASREKSLTPEETQRRQKLLDWFDYHYQKFYKNKIAWSPKEICSANSLVKKYTGGDFRIKLPIFLQKCKQDSFYTLTPSCLLSQWNKIVIVPAEDEEAKMRRQYGE